MNNNLVIGDKYRLEHKIGSGCFGDVYLVTNINTNEQFAAKLESIRTRYPQLAYEYKVYPIVHGNNFPKMYWSGRQEGFNILIMDLLGPSLHDLFSYCNRKFTLKTVLMLSDKMISQIQFLHSKNFIHRDIEPNNFLIDLNNDNIYLIDYGLSKRYRDPRTKKHIPYKEGKSLIGTSNLVSINTHLGIETSRRDDLESLGYLLIKFMTGKLPWDGIKGCQTKKEKYIKMGKIKMKLTPEELCKNINIRNDEFVSYIKYCRNLKFDEAPNYQYLQNLFKRLFIKNGYHIQFGYNVKNINNNKREICNIVMSEDVIKSKIIQTKTKYCSKNIITPNRLLTDGYIKQFIGKYVNLPNGLLDILALYCAVEHQLIVKCSNVILL